MKPISFTDILLAGKHVVYVECEEVVEKEEGAAKPLPVPSKKEG